MNYSDNTTTTDAVDITDQDVYVSLTVSLFVLWFGMWLISAIRRSGILWFPESTALLLLGIVVGFVLRFASESGGMILALDRLTQFNQYMFFILFLPPIVFEASYSMSHFTFFDNFLLVSLLAFLGTTLTMIFTGLIMYGIGQLGTTSVLRMNVLYNMIFGAIVSATDPVAVLVVFSQLGVDTVLFALVLGESVLNDAVALVLYQTILRFETTPLSFVAVLSGIGTFAYIFICSMIIGCLFGVLAAIFFKYTPLRLRKDVVRIESGLCIVIPYLSYFFAQGLNLSGITSIMFCGIAMSRYADNSLSRSARTFVAEAYGAVSQTFEAFIFIYMGISFAALTDDDWGDITYALSAFGAVVIARLLHVLVCVWISNTYRWGHPERQLNVRGTFMLFIVGLRGPMAFAIASNATTTLADPRAGRLMKTATVILICITTPLIGLVTPFLVRRLRLNKEKSASSGGWSLSQLKTLFSSKAEESEEGVDWTENGEEPQHHHFFARLDRHWLMPALSLHTVKRQESAEDHEGEEPKATPPATEKGIDKVHKKVEPEKGEDEEPIETGGDSDETIQVEDGVGRVAV